ncbi:MAG: serine hydrolase domain-containing protein [Eubacteriales bacterium]
MPATIQAYDNKSLKVNTLRLDYLDELLQSYIDKDCRQFIIVRAHRYGVPIYEFCGGVSTKEYGIKQDTISCVFSITKSVTSTQIMILQEQGLLDIAEPVCTYLDHFRGGDKESVLIWHLMTHSSGIDDNGYRKFRDDYISGLGLDIPGDNASQEEEDEFHRLLAVKLGLPENASEYERSNALFALYQLPCPPGERMMYSNTGYAHLGRIIEKVSGKSLNDFSREFLFGPLGMDDSYFCLPPELFHKVAGRSERCSETPWINTPDNFTWPGAMGGLKTTVIDLCRFGDMLLNGGALDGVRILSPASIREMSKNHNAILKQGSEWDSWGLGFNLRGTKKDDAGVLRSVLSLEHGGMCGHKFIIDPVCGVSISVFTGEYSPPGKNIFCRINNLILSAMD